MVGARSRRRQAAAGGRSGGGGGQCTCLLCSAACDSWSADTATDANMAASSSLLESLDILAERRGPGDVPMRVRVVWQRAESPCMAAGGRSRANPRRPSWLALASRTGEPGAGRLRSGRCTGARAPQAAPRTPARAPATAASKESERDAGLLSLTRRSLCWARLIAQSERRTPAAAGAVAQQRSGRLQRLARACAP